MTQRADPGATNTIAFFDLIFVTKIVISRPVVVRFSKFEDLHDPLFMAVLNMFVQQTLVMLQASETVQPEAKLKTFSFEACSVSNFRCTEEKFT